jgi:hypothetical protein
MTMPNAFHPDDERLAAYAGGDADAVSDRALVEHLSSCDRCPAIVEELTLLRRALAALPDLSPSRPLRLIPPVPAAAPRAVGALPWLRRLAAPAMAAGAGLVLVGAVGMSGLVGPFGAASAGRNLMELGSASDSAGAPAPGAAESQNLSPATIPDNTGKSDNPADETAATASSEPRASRDEDVGAVGSPNDGQNGDEPWPTVLIAGAALFGVSTVLRFSLTPRAG